jgi:tetratricopeptide (TPR) repeat protein
MKESTKLVLLSSACVLCYSNSLFCDFVFDDVSAIKDNKDIRPETPLSQVFQNDFWGISMTKEQSHKSYRPLCVLTYRLNYLLHGLAPLGYHLVNILLHTAVTLLYRSTLRLYVSSSVSLVSALLFAVHPIHSEAVTGVVGRAELLSSIFFLLALSSYTRCSMPRSTLYTPLAATALLTSLAMLCKEQGITVIGLCVVHELCLVQKLHHLPVRLKTLQLDWPRLAPLVTRLAALTATAGLLLLLRISMMQGSTLPVFTKFDNPASLAPASSKYLTYSYLPALNSWLLLCPSSLCCDWTMGTVPLVTSLSDPRNMSTLLLIAVVSHIVVVVLTSATSHSTRLAISLSWTVIPFVPASNLFFPVGFVVAERILYIPSMGFCLLVSIGFHRLYSVSRKHHRLLHHFLVSSLLFLLTFHALKTVTRNSDWSDERSIFQSGLKVNTRNAKLFNNVGHALESNAPSAALALFHQAVLVQPDDIGAHINIGRTYNALGLFAEAERAYLAAKKLLPRASPGTSLVARIAPNSLNVFLNLGNLVARNTSRLEEADRLYRQAIAMRSDYVQAYINRGDVLLKMNRSDEALSVYQQALRHDPDNPDIHYNLGVVALAQGRPEAGLAYLNRAVELDPAHAESLLNSAIVIQELGRPDLRPLAVARLKLVLGWQPRNERVHFNLGMLATDDKDVEAAEAWFNQAIAIKPDFRSALFNLALLLSDQQRPLEAVPYLRQLLDHHPDHVKGLILLGDIYTNHLKQLDMAEACYRRILAVDPTNVQGQHNLCVIMVEKGNLAEAERCLVTALGLAPHETYIQRHLGIVRSRMAARSHN